MDFLNEGCWEMESCQLFSSLGTIYDHSHLFNQTKQNFDLRKKLSLCFGDPEYLGVDGAVWKCRRRCNGFFLTIWGSSTPNILNTQRTDLGPIFDLEVHVLCLGNCWFTSGCWFKSRHASRKRTALWESIFVWFMMELGVFSSNYMVSCWGQPSGNSLDEKTLSKWLVR